MSTVLSSRAPMYAPCASACVGRPCFKHSLKGGNGDIFPLVCDIFEAEVSTRTCETVAGVPSGYSTCPSMSGGGMAIDVPEKQKRRHVSHEREAGGSSIAGMTRKSENVSKGPPSLF